MTDHSHYISPSKWVLRFAPMIPEGGEVLDVACGSGRHTAYLVRQGHHVVAIDRDISALPKKLGIEVIEADLEDGSPWPLQNRKFNAIVVCNYLYRPLFPILIGSLGPNSLLIYETFAAGNEQFGRPRRKEYLLQPGELLDVFANNFDVIAYEYGMVRDPEPRVVERIVVMNTDDERIINLPPALPPS